MYHRIQHVRFLPALFASVAILLASAVTALAAPNEHTEKGSERVFVHFASVPGENERNLVQAYGGTVTHSFTIIPAVAATIPAAAQEALLRNPNVLMVEPDYEVHASAVYDAEYSNGWGIGHINAGAAHTEGITGAGVKVGIIDSGVDGTFGGQLGHSDLNVVGGYNFWNFNTDWRDVYGHGTHVAGTACALDNGQGVVGVAPDCELYSLRVLSDTGGGYESDIIYAIEWALGDTINLKWRGRSYGSVTGTRLDVVNMSLGSQQASNAFEQACDNAYARGLILIAAAGNDGSADGGGNSVDYPGAFDSVIAVAATDQGDTRAPWSSTGPGVEISAPGVSVLSSWNDNSSQYDPQPYLLDGEYYKEGSGTSMATPHIAGVAALLLSAGVTDTNGLYGRADEVRALLHAGARDVGPTGVDTQYGYGVINVAQALAAFTPPSYATLSGYVRDTSTQPIAGAVVSVGTSDTTTDTSGYYNFSSVLTGEYVVEVSATGYLPSSATITLSANDTASQDFVLEAVPQGEDVLVSAQAPVFTASGGKNRDRHLTVTTRIVDEQSQAVEGATVTLELTHNGSTVWTGDMTSDQSGSVSYTYTNAPSGDYVATVINVITPVGYTWDGVPASTTKTK